MAYIDRPLRWMNSVIGGKGVEFENPLFCSPSSGGSPGGMSKLWGRLTWH